MSRTRFAEGEMVTVISGRYMGTEGVIQEGRYDQGGIMYLIKVTKGVKGGHNVDEVDEWGIEFLRSMAPREEGKEIIPKDVTVGDEIEVTRVYKDLITTHTGVVGFVDYTGAALTLETAQRQTIFYSSWDHCKIKLLTKAKVKHVLEDIPVGTYFYSKSLPYKFKYVKYAEGYWIQERTNHDGTELVIGVTEEDFARVVYDTYDCWGLTLPK